MQNENAAAETETGYPSSDDDKKRPVHSVKIGRIETAIWENEAKNGSTFLSVTVYRTYKDDAGNFHQTTCFNRESVDHALQGLEIARQWMDAQTNKEAHG